MARTALRLYKSYVFIDKDPVIDVMRTIVADSKLTNKQVHEASDVAVQTLRNWFGGKTKRPQFATVAAVSLALGKPIHFGSIKLIADDYRPAVMAALREHEKRKKADGK